MSIVIGDMDIASATSMKPYIEDDKLIISFKMECLDRDHAIVMMNYAISNMIRGKTVHVSVDAEYANISGNCNVKNMEIRDNIVRLDLRFVDYDNMTEGKYYLCQ